MQTYRDKESGTLQVGSLAEVTSETTLALKFNIDQNNREYFVICFLMTFSKIAAVLPRNEEMMSLKRFMRKVF